MSTATIYYVKGLREIESEPQPDSRIVKAVDRINEAYRRVGIDYVVRLIDVDSFLNGLRDEDLSSITGSEGGRKDLIRIIQEPILFEEARTKEGIVFKKGGWYKDGEELKPVKLYNVDFDELNFRFIKNFDIHAIAEKMYFLEWAKEKKIFEFAGGIYHSREEFVEKRMDETYPSFLTKVIQTSSQNPTTHNVFRLETMVNDALNRAYLEANIKPFNSYRREIPISLLDRCAMYINSIQNSDKRGKEFKRFLRIMEYGFRKDKGRRGYVRVMPAVGYEKEVGDYPYIEALVKLLKVSIPEEDVMYLLLDRYLSKFYTDFSEPKIYYILRHNNPTDRGCPGTLSTLTVESVQLLLLHEFAHGIADAKDIEELDNEADRRLMAAPVHYRDFNLGKLSDESIRVAYKKDVRREI